MKKPVIIDTDPGTDDALALIMAMNSPELDIIGITTIAGNARITDTTLNALRIMNYLGYSHVPVFQGSKQPLEGNYQFGYDYHGLKGLPVELPISNTKSQTQDAHEYLIDCGKKFPRVITIIALGPLTNVARAILTEPRLVHWINKIIIMGGAFEVEGNRTPYAEFNILNDAYAAHLVFNSGIPILVVGLDVCTQVAFERSDLVSWTSNSVGGCFAKEVVSTWFNETKPELNRYILCDPLAIAASVTPDIFETCNALISVDVKDPMTYGKTHADYGAGNVDVAVGVDVNRARAFVIERLAIDLRCQNLN